MAKITRTATITFVTVMMLAASLGLLPGTTSAGSQSDAALTYEPTEGLTGTAISVSGEGCFLPAGPEDRRGLRRRGRRRDRRAG